MMPPSLSTSLSRSGMALISLDFSARTACHGDKPSSRLQTLTPCKAPSPWLRHGAAAPSCQPPASSVVSLPFSLQHEHATRTSTSTTMLGRHRAAALRGLGGRYLCAGCRSVIRARRGGTRSRTWPDARSKSARLRLRLPPCERRRRRAPRSLEGRQWSEGLPTTRNAV